ncbi:MAG: ferritin-like domain-containing protein [Thermoplasmata archaeon]
MGQKGKEIVGPAVGDILSMLNQAVAAEAMAAYRYLYLSKWAAGLNAPEIAEAFHKISGEEWNHMSSLMERVIELGGRPLSRPSDWETNSYMKFYEPPKDQTDLKTMVEDSLAGERVAIEFYRDLVRKTEGKDAVTYYLAIELLADEVRDEEYFEKLLEGWK